MYHLILEGLFFIHNICWNRHCYWWNDRWLYHSYGDRHCCIIISYEGRYKFNYLLCVSFLRIVVSNTYCAVFLFFFYLALCTICCQFLSFIHSWLSLRFPLTEIYFVMYLLFKQTSFNKIFSNKRFYVWLTSSRAWPTEVNGSLYER
jgi:hypothetical protein